MYLSLRTTLVLLLSGLQLAAAAAILIPAYVNSERTLLQHARTLMRDVAFATIAHSDRFLAPAEAAAKLSKRLAEQEIVASDDPDLLEKVLFEQLQLAPQFSGIFYGDASGNFVYVMRAEGEAPGPYRSKHVFRDDDAVETHLRWRDPDFKLIESRLDPNDRYDPRERPWYQDAEARAGTVWTDPYIFYTSQNPGITVASPIFEADGGIQGVVGVDIEIGAISDFLARLKIGERGQALVMNQNGDVIAHPRPEIIKTRAKGDAPGLRFAGIHEIEDPIAQAAFASLLADGEVRLPTNALAYDEADGGKHISTDFEYQGADYVATIAPMPNPVHPWTIGVYAPKDDFVGALKADRNRSIAVALAIAGATAFVGALLASRVHAPVRALADRANQISQGRLIPPAPFPRSFSELQRAGAAFNRMSAWLQDYRTENGQLADNLRQASDVLEQRVKERTEDLASVNRKLQQEIETRAEAEETLKREVRQHADTEARLRMALSDVASANDAKTRFLSSMSHELRSPLNAIIGFAEMLNERKEELPPEKHTEYLGHIRTSGGHLLTLVDDVLDLQNVESGKMPLNLMAIDVKTAIAQARMEQGVPARRRGCRIDDTTTKQYLPLVSADANRLRQVLVNLVSNAIKYGPDGATVAISAEATPTTLRITVTDQGPGIPPELQGRLFDPFDRLGAEASGIEGTGVGLALAKQLIESMGGRIGFESERGVGSKFWVELQVVKATAHGMSLMSMDVEDVDEPTTAATTGRILYVDDNPLNLKLVSDFLNARGPFALVTAETGAMGLELSHVELFDLYLVDINLPDISGFDFLKAIRELHPDATVIAVSADAMPNHVEAGLQAGFDGYVTKPVRLNALAQEIDSRLAPAD